MQLLQDPVIIQAQLRQLLLTRGTYPQRTGTEAAAIRLAASLTTPSSFRSLMPMLYGAAKGWDSVIIHIIDP